MRQLMLALTLAAAPFPGWTAPVSIPAGPVQMGCSADDPACESDEGPAGGTTVEIPAFRIDSHEVTVAEYRTCVENGKCTAPLTYARNQYCNYDAPDRDRHPVNCIDWVQAQAFCASRGGRLPYEAEWEKAARAGSSTRYPWGQEVSCRQAILDDKQTRGSAGSETDGCGEDRTWPVGSRPANALGLYDMHGNAGEWTANWYAPDGLTRYMRGDLSGPARGRQRVVRGGSWDEDPANLRSSFRNVKPPKQNGAIYGSIGFRCAYDARQGSAD